jgi:hypothetical protein
VTEGWASRADAVFRPDNWQRFFSIRRADESNGETALSEFAPSCREGGYGEGDFG